MASRRPRRSRKIALKKRKATTAPTQVAPPSAMPSQSRMTIRYPHPSNKSASRGTTRPASHPDSAKFPYPDLEAGLARVKSSARPGGELNCTLLITLSKSRCFVHTCRLFALCPSHDFNLQLQTLTLSLEVHTYSMSTSLRIFFESDIRHRCLRNLLVYV